MRFINVQTKLNLSKKITTSTEGGCCTAVLLPSFIPCTLWFHPLSHISHAHPAEELSLNKNRLQVWLLEIDWGRERHVGRHGGGANIRKPQLVCVCVCQSKGHTHGISLKARHYRDSQMIALAKTTGWAARLQPPQTTWLGAREVPNFRFYFFPVPHF